MDAAILSQVLESHDRLIGVIDAAGVLVQANGRARALLASALGPGAGAAGSRQRGGPRALLDAAGDARRRGVVRRGILVRTDAGELFLHGHFWPMSASRVGFALRTHLPPESAAVARALGVPPWQAQKALRVAQQLSDQEIANALAAGSGNVGRCIRRLSAGAASRRARTLRAPLRTPRPNLVEAEAPAALPTSDADSRDRAPRAAPSGARVLCVVGEGQEGYAERLTEMLASLGHAPTAVVTAADARETLDLTKPYFDAVLVNLDMPAYAVIELGSTIRRAHPETRLAFYTAGGASEDTVERARRLGPVLPRAGRADEARRAVDHATRAERELPSRPRFASGSRPGMRIRSILAALRLARSDDAARLPARGRGSAAGR